MDKNAIFEYKWPNTKRNKKPVLKCQMLYKNEWQIIKCI